MSLFLCFLILILFFFCDFAFVWLSLVWWCFPVEEATTTTLPLLPVIARTGTLTRTVAAAAAAAAEVVAANTIVGAHPLPISTTVPRCIPQQRVALLTLHPMTRTPRPMGVARTEVRTVGHLLPTMHLGAPMGTAAAPASMAVLIAVAVTTAVVGAEAVVVAVVDLAVTLRTEVVGLCAALSRRANIRFRTSHISHG